MVVGDRWQEAEPELRKDWESKYGHTGLDWMEIREAYHFGWIAGQRPELRNRHWEEIERDLESHWYRPQLAEELASWDYVKEAVREGFEKGKRVKP